MKWPLERKILGSGFALAMLILSIVSIVSYQNTVHLFQRQKQVEKSYEVLQKVRDVLTTLRDAERARRGYIITGKESYLGTYNSAIQEIHPKFNAIRRLTAENPQHQQKLDFIEPLIAERVALIQKSVTLYKRNKSDTATQIALTDRGIMLHDEIWKVIAQMEAEEQLILQRRAAESEATFQYTMLISIAGYCLSFGLFFTIYALLHLQVKKCQHTEKILRESEKRYRSLFELHPYPLWVFDSETLAFLAVNDAAINHYGYSQNEFLSMTIKDIRPPEDVPPLLDKISQLAPKVAGFGEWKHQKRDGTLIDVEIRSHELFFDGRRARLILARDITEQKQAQEALQASEEKFRQIAENIHEVFWISNSDLSKILYVNPAYEQIWGLPCESLYTDSKSFLNSVHPEDLERVMVTFNQNPTNEYEIEYRIIRDDGSVRWVWDRCFPIRNAAGDVYRRGGVTQDITERKRAEEVRRTLEKERELNELKLRLFSMISHEFRTPLSTILVSAQLLENSSKEWSEEKKLKNLHRIQSAAKTMNYLLSDILTLTRAETGNLEFNPQPLDLESFCQSLVEETEVSYRAQQNIFFISDSSCKQVIMDEKLLRSILTNLLSNAIKYSSEDSNIYFILSCESEKAVFQIQDQGIGIPLEAQKNLYDFFYRCQNVGDVPGIGLGLPVVKKCVELHGGNISVESKVRVGTTFTVTIPLKHGGKKVN